MNPQIDIGRRFFRPLHCILLVLGSCALEGCFPLMNISTAPCGSGALDGFGSSELSVNGNRTQSYSLSMIDVEFDAERKSISLMSRTAVLSMGEWAYVWLAFFEISASSPNAFYS